MSFLQVVHFSFPFLVHFLMPIDNFGASESPRTSRPIKSLL
jgi:hypothetical protein